MADSRTTAVVGRPLAGGSGPSGGGSSTATVVANVDPVEFLRAALKVSKEDAEKVRADAAKKAACSDK